MNKIIITVAGDYINADEIVSVTDRADAFHRIHRNPGEAVAVLSNGEYHILNSKEEAYKYQDIIVPASSGQKAVRLVWNGEKYVPIVHPVAAWKVIASLNIAQPITAGHGFNDREYNKVGLVTDDGIVPVHDYSETGPTVFDSPEAFADFITNQEA